MGLVDEIPSGSRVALDADAIIYLIEQHERFRPVVRPVFESIAGGLVTAVVSVVTLLEVLVLPLRTGRDDLVAAYRRLLTTSVGVSLRPVDTALAEEAAALRAAHNLRTPDALVAATAVVEGCSHLVSSDPAFSRVSSPLRPLIISQFTDA